MILYTYDYCINLMEVRKIDFSTNGVHIKDNEAIIPAFCMEFRLGFNGTSPGSKIQKKHVVFIVSFTLVILLLRCVMLRHCTYYAISTYIFVALQPPGLKRSD